MAYTEFAIYTDSAQWTAVAPFAVSTAYNVGQIVRQLATPTANNERCFICVIAGTSAGSEPSWTLTRGASTVSNTATFRECTGQPAVNGDGTNTNAWAASKGTITLGTIIKNVAATHYFICTTSNTGGTGTEPTWNTTAGATTTDGSAVWTCIGAVGSFTTKWAAPCARLRLPLNGATSWLVNADMTVFVGDDHAETNSSGSPLFQAGANCQVICIDHTAALPAGSANLRTTASITESGSNLNFMSTNSAYVYGLQLIDNTTGILAVGGGGARFRFEQCLLSKIGSTSNQTIRIGDTTSTGTIVEFKDCTFHLQTTSQAISVQGGTIRWENCSITGTFGGSGALVFTGGAFANLIVEGCDLSNIPSNSILLGALTVSYNPNGYYCFKDCKFPTSFLPYTTSDANIRETVTIDFVRCSSGAVPYNNERHARNGTLTTSTSIIRTGGASDGVTAVSHKIDTTANALDPYQRFGALPLTTWNDVTGSNRTVTLYGLANDSRVPTDGEVFFDAEYLGQASSPDGDYKRGYKANVLAIATALTADTSAWVASATRANSTAYTVGQAIKVASNPGRVFICIGVGTSAGSEPGGYASAIDGGSVTDGTATFRAACRFRQTLTLNSPQPAQAGYLYVTPRFARASQTYYLDPKIILG